MTDDTTPHPPGNCLHPDCIRQNMAEENERLRKGFSRDPFTPDEPHLNPGLRDTFTTPDNYPGWEKDLNNGTPLDLADLTSALGEGVALQEAGYKYTTGNMGLELGSREVFVLVRHGDGRESSYWVTGVRLLPDESGSSSIAGAIELIAEDGDRAQQRQLDKEHRLTAETLIANVARTLASVKSNTISPSAEDVADMRNTAAHVLREFADVLDIDSDLAEYL